MLLFSKQGEDTTVMTRVGDGKRCNGRLTHRMGLLNKHNPAEEMVQQAVLVIQATILVRILIFLNSFQSKICCLPHASYQFPHAALLSNAILTFVVEAHLAGFATKAMFRRVSRQEHHMLGRRA